MRRRVKEKSEKRGVEEGEEQRRERLRLEKGRREKKRLEKTEKERGVRIGMKRLREREKGEEGGGWGAGD